MSKPVQIVDAVIKRGTSFLLVQQRKPHAYGLWGFPGGHVEPGESFKIALRREVKEEVGLEVTNLKLIKNSPFDPPDGAPILAHTYLAKTTGEIVLNEDELLAYDFFTAPQIRDLDLLVRSPWIIPLLSILEGREW